MLNTHPRFMALLTSILPCPRASFAKHTSRHASRRNGSNAQMHDALGEVAHASNFRWKPRSALLHDGIGDTFVQWIHTPTRSVIVATSSFPRLAGVPQSVIASSAESPAEPK